MFLAKEKKKPRWLPALTVLVVEWLEGGNPSIIAGIQALTVILVVTGFSRDRRCGGHLLGGAVCKHICKLCYSGLCST